MVLWILIKRLADSYHVNSQRYKNCDVDPNQMISELICDESMLFWNDVDPNPIIGWELSRDESLYSCSDVIIWIQIKWLAESYHVEYQGDNSQ